MPRHQRKDRDERRHRRLRVRFSAVNAPEEVRTGFTEDVTARGLFIQCGVVLPPRTHIVMELDVDGRPIRVTGRVVWAKRAPSGLAGNKRHGMGVKLDDNSGTLAQLAVRR